MKNLNKLSVVVYTSTILLGTLSGCTSNLHGGAQGSNAAASTNIMPSIAVELSSSWTPHWSNILGYWKLDNDFTATVGPALTVSAPGASISKTVSRLGNGSANFDGTSDAAAPASAIFSFPNTTFTVAAWVNTTSPAGFIVSNGMVNAGWAVDLDNNGRFRAEAKNCANAQITMTGVVAVNDGQWHHVVAVIHTDTVVETNTTFQIYVDGVFYLRPLTYPGNGPYCDPGNTRSLALAARNVPQGPISFYPGYIDELAIWNVGLTASDVVTLYNNQSGTYAQMNLFEQSKILASREQFYSLGHSFFGLTFE